MTKITNFVWNSVDDCIISELDGTGAVQAVYTNEPQQYGGVISQRRGTTTSTYHYDALGSTRMLTDSSGNVTDTYLHDAWGNNVASTGTTVNPFKWVGKYGYYTDDGTGQVYVRARMYQPTVARWMSVDPLFFSASKKKGNLAAGRTGNGSSDYFSQDTANPRAFVYAEDNPTCVTDASGLQPDPCVVRNLCYCGPDVGTQLVATLQHAIKVFEQTSFWTKRWWCNNPALWLSWDLYPECWDRPGANPKCGACVRGTSPNLQACVTVFGKKHNNWNVNYVLWGAMAGLCGLSDIGAVAFAKLHKQKKYVFGESECGYEWTDTLKAWVMAGYNFIEPDTILPSPPVPLSMGMPQYDDPDFEGCVSCPDTYGTPAVPCNFRWFNNNDVVPK
jgi:RHS repeat-associated protein